MENLFDLRIFYKFWRQSNQTDNIHATFTSLLLVADHFKTLHIQTLVLYGSIQRHCKPNLSISYYRELGEERDFEFDFELDLDEVLTSSYCLKHTINHHHTYDDSVVLNYGRIRNVLPN